MGQDKKKATPSAEWAASDPHLEFFEDSANCIQRCAQGIADGLASAPDEEKEPSRLAVLRNWWHVLALGRARWGWK